MKYILLTIVTLLLLFLVYTYKKSLFDDDYLQSFDLTANNIDTTEQFDRWIVITTINYATVDVRQYAQMFPNWRLVIVADRKTPIDWMQKNNVNCVFLSLQEQKTRLKYKTIRLIPYNSYTRKVIGYLYAIEHGAKWIYDTDDDNGPYGNCHQNSH
jgi:hypothetical protein